MFANKSISRIFSVLFVVIFMLAGLPARPVSAYVANYYVAKTGSDAGSNNCMTASSPCLTIVYTITQSLSNGTINIAAGTYTENLSVAKSLTLKGAGMNLTFLDGGGSDRVLYTDYAMSIYDLTIQNGSTAGDGGGIRNNSATMNLTRVKVANNSAHNGAGIMGDGPLVMTDCVISGNHATGVGGGLFLNQTGTSSLTNVTVSGNVTSLYGGGIHQQSGGTLNLTNATISGNTAGNDGGGGLSTSTSTVNILNSTIAGNHSGGAAPGGIISFSATFNNKNTIIAGNGNDNCYFDVSVTNNSLGNNLDSGNTCGFSQLTDLHSTDPQLGPLADNGGPTQTQALLAGSPAINAGTNTGCPTTDQRGVNRPQPSGGMCDIGAYEYFDTTAPTVNTFTVTTPSNSLNIPITAFSATDNVAVTGYLITESATVPAVGATGWSVTAPTSYTVASDGTYTLYPWAKDATGNVSAVFGSPRTVLVDTTKPVLNTFTVTTPSNSFNIPISAFTATDAGGLAGYMITTSAIAPTAGATGWTVTSPTTYTVVSDGTYTLYPWVKDATGNVSVVFGSPRTVVVDTIFRIFLPLIMR